MDPKSFPVFNKFSIMRSHKNQTLFITLSSEPGQPLEETVALNYAHAYKLAIKILSTLQDSSYEDVVKNKDMVALLSKQGGVKEDAKESVRQKEAGRQVLSMNKADLGIATHVAKKDEEKATSKGIPRQEELKEVKRPTQRIPWEEMITLEEGASLQRLEQFYQTGSPEVRLQVVRILARRQEAKVLTLLIRGCQDEDARVRRLATNALGNFPSEETVNTLLEQIKDFDKVVRLKAIESLGKIGDRSVAPALTDALTDPSVTIRRNVAELLGTMGDAKMVSMFAKVLKDEDEYVRMSAIKALGRIGGCVAASALAIAMKDADPKIRTQAACALGEVGNASVVPILLASLNFDEVPEVRQNAAEALGKLGDQSAHNQMLRILKDESEEENVRAAIAKALGKMGTFADIPALVTLLRDRCNIIRIQSAFALGKLKDPVAANALQHLVKADPDPHVREAATQSLGDIGDKRCSDTIIKALKDKNANVRAAAATSLAKLNIIEAIDHLNQAREDTDDYVRSQVTKALQILQKR